MEKIELKSVTSYYSIAYDRIESEILVLDQSGLSTTYELSCLRRLDLINGYIGRQLITYFEAMRMITEVMNDYFQYQYKRSIRNI